MAEKYFTKFNKITYNNYTAIDITERAVVTNDFFKNPYMFYPYDISEGERADQLSDRYYDDQYMTWMIYLGNKITDPYYQWYLSDADLNSYLVKKYNTNISTLQDKVQFYRNNWYEENEQISVSEYNLLANTVHKYWQPFYNNTNKIAGYQRVQKDWVINTNSIRQYTPSLFNYSAPSNGSGHYDVNTNSLTVGIPNPSWVTAIQNDFNACTITFANGYTVSPTNMTGPAHSTNIYTFTGEWAANSNAFPILLSSTYGVDISGFEKGEIVDIHFDTTHSGQGEVIFANTNTLNLKNISGTSLPNNTVTIGQSSYLRGRNSNTTASIATASNIVDNIPLDEGIYWSPVSVYDYEKENNEKNRSINVIDNTYSMKISNQLSRLLK